MEEKNRTDINDKLRSEKVRRLLGEIPPSLTIWGLLIIVGVFAALVAAISLLPYPYSEGETILQHILKSEKSIPSY